ncbi:MAG: molybdopterin-guanine dinucleotide biosynthesis protein B [Syntrophus sp. (in: bacteria)]|nr:molybdopterin-guanine dinucleotide biosynthesis protein B [Syntrophus sp. (in: bacteria)]
MKKGIIPVIAFVGHANSGKTTIIEKLIPLFSSRGIRVAVIKHHHLHDFEIDIPGKDTFRYKKAGAVSTIIASPGKIALVTDVEGDLPVEEIILRYVMDADLIIVEGYKKAAIPKIEVYIHEEGGTPVCHGDKNLMALITDQSIEYGLPRFLRNDIEGIAEFIVVNLIRRNAF